MLSCPFAFISMNHLIVPIDAHFCGADKAWSDFTEDSRLQGRCRNFLLSDTVRFPVSDRAFSQNNCRTAVCSQSFSALRGSGRSGACRAVRHFCGVSQKGLIQASRRQVWSRKRKTADSWHQTALTDISAEAHAPAVFPIRPSLAEHRHPKTAELTGTLPNLEQEPLSFFLVFWTAFSFPDSSGEGLERSAMDSEVSGDSCGAVWRAGS